MLPRRDSPQDKTPTQTESEGLEENIPRKYTGKNGVAILISDKIDFKTGGGIFRNMYRGYMDKPKWVGSRVESGDGWVGGSCGGGGEWRQLYLNNSK